MSFWKKLFGQKTPPVEKITESTTPPQPQSPPELPTVIALIPDKLSVKVFYHEIATNQGKINCLCYLTQGLRSVGQRELLLTLKNNQQTYRLYDPPLHFFKQVYAFASNGRIVNRGNMSQFGQNDMLGWKGVVYSDVPASIQDAVPLDTLAMVLLSLEEVQSLQNFGYMRILSMLGKEKRFYPFPYWSDLDRKPLPIKAIAARSLLYKVQASISMAAATLTMQNNQVTFRLPKHLDSKSLPQEVLPSNLTVAILPSLAADADGCLTWSFDNSVTDAIVPNGSKGNHLSGCFLVLVPEQPSNSTKVFEDGFAIMVTKKDWVLFWEALIHKRNLTIAAHDHSMNFNVEWI
jgi:hypothetical protein